MSYPIKFLSLQKAELEYEVGVRGGTTGESVQELRKQIVKLAQILPSEDILESHLEPKDDLLQLHETLQKAKTNIDSLKSKFDKNLYFRTETILHHAYYRLIRIDRTSETRDLYTECNKIWKIQVQDLSLFKSKIAQSSVSFQTSSASTAEVVTVTSGCDRKIESEVVNQLKFSGKSCVRSFIQKAEELVEARNIPKSKLLSFAVEIFTDDALHWFRCIKDKAQSWDEVVELLKQDFSQNDYDYRLLAEIRMRTQGEHENIIIYLSVMHGMFSRLDKKVSEADQLDIILHNIRPCYASTLAASPNIDSIEKLKTICRSYENIQSRMAQFHEPPKITRDTVAPEFAYNKPSTSNNYTNKNYNYTNYRNKNYYYKYNDRQFDNKIHLNDTKCHLNETQTEKKIEVSPISVDSRRPGNVYCPRCRIDTHSLGQCTEPHFPICFKCGKKGVRYPDCTECNSSSTSKN